MLEIGTKIYIADDETDCDTGLQVLIPVTIKTIYHEFEVMDEKGVIHVVRMDEIKGLYE